MALVRSFYVDAAPAGVWSILTDVERWPEWTGTITRMYVERGASLGLGALVHAESPGGRKTEWTVTEFDAPRSLTWEMRPSAGVVVSSGHVIMPEGDGSRVTFAVNTRGWAGRLLAPLVHRQLRPNLESEVTGFKRRAEERARGEPQG
ncbi:MAG TPA: SRPBCC family protein [Dehalococcoidia bacterium]|nr:SRPBCC family protein [Dehalococcoidia bacterium]